MLALLIALSPLSTGGLQYQNAAEVRSEAEPSVALLAGVDLLRCLVLVAVSIRALVQQLHVHILAN